MAAARRSAGFSAVILAGGTGARLGGVDKGSIEVHGTSLLERAVAAVAGGREVVVVGPPAPLGEAGRTGRAGASRVRFVVEEPPRGGPAAGLLAGIGALTEPDVVVVLAVDMPYVDAGTVERLLAALDEPEEPREPGEPGESAESAERGAVDGAFLIDGSGRQQLAGVVRVGRLSPPAERHGLPLHRLLRGLRLVDVPALDREAVDIDTIGDLRDLRAPGPA